MSGVTQPRGRPWIVRWVPSTTKPVASPTRKSRHEVLSIRPRLRPSSRDGPDDIAITNKLREWVRTRREYSATVDEGRRAADVDADAEGLGDAVADV
jgi:hypothetical protein